MGGRAAVPPSRPYNALHYHFVFITKICKPVLRGDVGTEVRDLIRKIPNARH